ncbi:MAG: tetratricopeptide repeat protein [Proteobacteria bacterium]|nr:tetratricopeptide repeat protein [Pseudomonadota bacterium]
MSQPSEGQDLDEVGQLFEQALDDYPGFSSPLLGLCDVFLRDYDQRREIELLVEAETRCLQALAVGSDPLNAHLALGRVFSHRGEAQVARTHFQRASSMAPDNPEAWTGLAKAAEMSGGDALARQYHQRAVQLSSAGWQAHMAYGTFLFMRGEFEAAAKHYQIVVRLYPDSLAAHSNLGSVWYSLGEFDRASDAWRRAIEIKPNAMAWGNLGAAYTYLKDYPAAMDAYQHATNMAPGDHRWLGHLGEIMVYDKNADHIGAEQYIQRALDLASSQLEYTRVDASVLARMSTYEALLGLKNQALNRAESARREDRDSIGVAYSVLQTYTLLHEATLAARERERLISLGYPELLLSRDPWLN